MRAPHALGVVCAALLTLGACSGSAPSTAPSTAPSAPTTTAKPQPPACEITATVDGVGYHQRGVYGDYQVDRADPLTGPLLLCRGGDPATATFYPIVDVPQKFAVAASVKGKVVVFLADDLPPIPAGSKFAHIMLGDQAD